MTDETRLRWIGNLEAQRQADEAFSRMRPKQFLPTPGDGKRRRKARRKWRKRNGIPSPAPVKIDHGKATSEEYKRYMASKKWKRKRKQAFEFYGDVCCVCKRTDGLRVHHVSYERFKDEAMEDLAVLCWKCHNRLHGRFQSFTDPIDEVTSEFTAIVQSF